MGALPFLTAVLACLLGTRCAVAGVYKDLDGCTTEEVEKCGTDFIPYYGSHSLATGAEEFQEQCSKFLSQLECSDDFATRCFDGFPKGAVLLVLRAARDEYEGFCNETSPMHKVYLDNIKCVNNAGVELSSCIDELIVGLHRSAAHAPDRQKIPYICCYYNVFTECARKALVSKCGLPDAEKFFDEIIEHVFGEVLSLACGKYHRDGDACATLTPLPTKDDSSVRNRGFVAPLVVIASKFG